MKTLKEIITSLFNLLYELDLSEEDFSYLEKLWKEYETYHLPYLKESDQ